ncbi:MAG: GNAT family N-acetyltransferase [Candidatus Micrarchaeota archaeon]|nr:GNAT family N-acetyltransferase [Candidatus Micrarchaeota archaeon]
MEELQIKIVETLEELKQAMEIRRKVFIEEQHVPEAREQDGKDAEAKHILVVADGKLVATARVRMINRTTAKLERMAVIKEYRGKGIGKKITEFIDVFAKDNKIKEIVTHSQWQVIPFYKKSGYEQRGHPFYDAGIGHMEMFKKV